MYWSPWLLLHIHNKYIHNKKVGNALRGALPF